MQGFQDTFQIKLICKLAGAGSSPHGQAEATNKISLR